MDGEGLDLYALGVGAGAADPTGDDLAYTTENSHGIAKAVLPTTAVVLGAGGRLTIKIWDLATEEGSGQYAFRTENQSGAVVLDRGRFRASAEPN